MVVPVLMDLEWIETADGRPSLTQLAAMRVNDAWQEQEKELFTAVLHPSGLESCEPDHVALNGHLWEEFQSGELEADVMARLAAWLCENDMIYLWHHSSKDALMMAWQSAFQTELPYEVACVRNRIGAALRKRGITSYSLYGIADALRKQADGPRHCAKSDVETMRRVLEALQTPVKAPGPKQQPTQTSAAKKITPRNVRNRDIISRTQYHYLFTPKSNVFHTRDCSRMLNAWDIKGSIYYATAAKGRRPCKICRPTKETRPMGALLREEKEKENDVGPDLDFREVITARVLGGNHVRVARGKLLGYCRNLIHPGWLTKALMDQHDCLAKECFFFQKNEYAPYWAAQEMKQKARQREKEKKKAETARQLAAQEAMIRLRDELQRYADATDSHMDVIRVELQAPNYCTVFYVSDNPFADGNRFMAFIAMIKSHHHGWRINLRHIMDLDNHFLTREEFYAMRRR